MASRVQLRDDYDAAVLRALAKRSRDRRQICRLLALAAVYDGRSVQNLSHFVLERVAELVKRSSPSV